MVDARKSLQELGAELERIANDIQGLSRELHPHALESLGLAEALKQECSTFCRRTGLAVPFESSGRPEEPKLEVGLALYRIAQEALRNCLTHSGSGTAAVRLVASETEVRLEVTDSGAGFDPAQVRRRLEGGEDGVTVTSVAYDCGFYHLGRLAGVYRRQFGELPSDTLRRARRR